jgi:hypothetical protein
MIKKALLLSTCLAGSAALSAQPAAPASSVKPAQASAPSAGLVNDWLRHQSPGFEPWSFGGQFRMRFEHRENQAISGVPGAVDFTDHDNTYLLLRQKLHLGYAPTPWVSLLAEGRNSTAHWDDRTPSPDQDRVDLHQAYIRLGDAKQFPLTATIGRQEFSYGDERLVGAFDWHNVGRVFDAARLRADADIGWAEAFVGRIVLPRDRHFNIANDYDYFSGLYTSSRTVIPRQETQLYFLARNVGEQSPEALGTGLPPLLRGASPRNVYTLGLRMRSLPGQYNGWDYSLEAAGQFGQYRFTADSPSLDHAAFAVHSGLGYTWSDLHGTPRLGLEYNFASGDDDPTDDRHGTFDNLFPTNHKFYGYMDFFSWRNIHNGRLASSWKPMRKLTLTGDYHAFWLADTRDYFYQVNGAPRTAGGYGLHPEAGSYVGSEINFVASYALRPYMNVQGGYGHFFTGSYVRDVLGSGRARDADWIYSQLTFNF